MPVPAGLIAYPLTPRTDEGIDVASLQRLVARAVDAGADGVGCPGSTGLYPYLSREERFTVVRAAVEAAGDAPVLAGVGSPALADVLRHAEDAARAGAAALLLAPVSYHALTDDELVGLYEDVASAADLPVVLYDNPGTTHVAFTLDLYARIAAVPGVRGLKIPTVPAAPEEARGRIAEVRSVVPDGTSVGVSGDWTAVEGLVAAADCWHSVLGGIAPATATALTRAATAGRVEEARELSARLEPLWSAFRRWGSLRTVDEIARHLGLIAETTLPRPLRPLPADAAEEVRGIVDRLEPA